MAILICAPARMFRPEFKDIIRKVTQAVVYDFVQQSQFEVDSPFLKTWNVK